MRIALLGYGTEGRATEKYFRNKFKDAIFDIFENETPEHLKQRDYSSYDIIFRSPSIPPLGLDNESTMTRYFFDHCPCPIIGVTGTKGKGTTCSLTHKILESLGFCSHLLGNIGTPSIEKLDSIQSSDVVVFEMSSFQLWDLEKSPSIAGILRIEPDHLDVHGDFQTYLSAKSNIAKHQTADDYLVYYKDNSSSKQLATLSPAHKLPYPLDESEPLKDILDSLSIIGAHNRENAEAALLLSFAYVKKYHGANNFSDFLTKNSAALKSALKDFTPLPHRLEFVRTIDGVDFYDDNYSASYSSLDVALSAFRDRPIILIAGGKNRGLDYQNLHSPRIFSDKKLIKAILIGENKGKIASAAKNKDQYEFADTLENAVTTAYQIAANLNTKLDTNPVVLMSPGSASFDMFKNFNDRGDKFKQLVNNLKQKGAE